MELSVAGTVGVWEVGREGVDVGTPKLNVGAPKLKAGGEKRNPGVGAEQGIKSIGWEIPSESGLEPTV